MKRLVISFILASAVSAIAFASAPTGAKAGLIETVGGLVEARFPDKDLLRQIQWPTLVTKARQSIGPNAPLELQQHVINELLGHLKSPVSALYSEADEPYYAWTSFLASAGHPPAFRSIGASFERRGAKWFVAHVFDGSPASGKLFAGDEIVSTGQPGFEPFAALQALLAEGKLSVTIRRKAGGPTEALTLPTGLDSWFATWIRDTRASQRIVNVCARKVGYLRLWAIGPQGFLETLRRAAQQFEKSADAFVIDLRDGLASGDPGDADGLFTPKSRNEVYHKPLYLLVNGDTAGPLEALAAKLRDSKRATIVGLKTAGALAPVDIVPIEGMGTRFALVIQSGYPPAWTSAAQGSGIKPDVAMDELGIYRAGVDPQYEAALRLAASCPK